MSKVINIIHKLLTENKPVVVIIILVGFFAAIYQFWPDKSAQIDDRDIIDNKGSINSVVNVTQIQNPKPRNRLSYKVISLNERNNNSFYSEFRLDIITPQGGSFSTEDIGVSPILSCEELPLEEGDILGSTGFGMGEIGSFSNLRVGCISERKVVDDGYLFFVNQ